MVKVSSTIRDDLAVAIKARAAARKVSVSRLVDEAVGCLDAMPRELRDLIVELRADGHDAIIRAIQAELSLMTERYRGQHDEA